MPVAHSREALRISDYALAVNETDRFSKAPQGIEKLRFGLFGEIGGLLAAVKKVHRDILMESETEIASEEIGDSLWYLVAVASAQGILPEQLGNSCLGVLRRRFGERDHDSIDVVTFRQIDGIVALHSNDLGPLRAELLRELASVSGMFIGQPRTPQRDIEETTPLDLLGSLLALLALVCGSFGLQIEEVARDNFAKVKGRWPGSDRQYVSLFDEDFDSFERLPRDFELEFIERGGQTAGHVVIRFNGVFIGDRLSDNSNEPDDYRFHDVFHLGYVAHLGWSPVVRALLKVKRKSKPQIDENEDGARAIIIEEGIATWIFNHAKKRDFYIGVEPGRLEYGLLKQVRGMVTGYEVEKCPPWQWELAILEGFRIFRELRKPENRGGRVIVRMDQHSIDFQRLQPKVP
jgi:NTP pyrophosphatase (non-canonical NTP hydrolase)